MSLLGILIVVAVGWIGLRAVAGRHRPSFGLGLKVLGIAAILGGVGLFWARSEFGDWDHDWQDAKHEWQDAKQEWREAKRDLLDEVDFSFDFDPGALHEKIHDDAHLGTWVQVENSSRLATGARFAIAAVLIILGALLIGREKTRPLAFKFATLLGVGAVIYGVFAFLAAPPREFRTPRIIARHEASDDREPPIERESREPRAVKPPKHAKLPARVKHPEAPLLRATPAVPGKPSRPSRVKRPALRPERPAASQTGANQIRSSELVMPPRAGEIPVSAELAKQATTVEAASVKSEVASEVQPTPPPTPAAEAPAPAATPAPPVDTPAAEAPAAPPTPAVESAPAAEVAVPAANPVPTESPAPVESPSPAPAEPPAAEAPPAEPAASAEASSAVVETAPTEAPAAQPAPEAIPAAVPATVAPAAQATPAPEPPKAAVAPVPVTPVAVTQRPADGPVPVNVDVPVDVPVKVQVNPIIESEAKLLSVPVTIESAEPAPEWVGMKPHLVKSDYQLPVSSGLFVSIPECQRELDQEMKRAADHYIDTFLGENASGVVDIPISYLKKHIKKQEYAQVIHSDSVGPMNQIHALLSFDDDARADFRRRWREAIVTNRLWYAGSGAGLVLALLGTLYGYLRLDHKTGGAHKGRLQLAATLVALVATAGVLVVRWAVPF